MSHAHVEPGTDTKLIRNVFASIGCSMRFDPYWNKFPDSPRIAGVHLGMVQVFKYRWRGQRRATRSMANIQTNPVDDFLIVLPQDIPVEYAQLGNASIVGPGSFVFLTTQKPFEALCANPANHAHTELVLKIPGPLIREHIAHLDQCCAIPIAAQRGAGCVMKQLMSSVLSAGTFLTEGQARTIGGMLVNVVDAATMEAPELRKLDIAPLSFHSRERVRVKAQEFIECNLSNPKLDCAVIAQHCRVSLRQLHASFERSSLTVGAFIRELRLQRCRNDLRNPALRYQKIFQIAMRWGYSSSEKLTRAYHDRFGKTPSEERRLLQSQLNNFNSVSSLPL